MIRVKNQKVITKLSKQSLQANRVRNIVAIFAVALTSLLFMTLFTIAGTMVYTFQQETFRLVGSSGHGSFKDLTLEQKEILEKDAMIQECGGRLFLGVGSGEKFRKVHAELSYMEPGYLKRSFCTPQQGRIPQEGTKEIACDTRILNCIGIQPDIGARLTFTYEVGGMEKTEITDTFILSGWWEYDQAAPASMAILPKSYVEEMVKRYPRKEGDMMDMTGTWTLDIMLGSSMHIGDDMQKILYRNGFLPAGETEESEENTISIGVNWAYAGAQLAANVDPQMVIAVLVILILIVFTGYLIIYNIFQISVSNDIRFYGLLKTIGTTGKQVRRMIRRQALFLSAAGIPIGLATGSAVGMALAPVILSVTSVKNGKRMMSPWFFLVSALFSLATVYLSCAKPGRMAAKVSPVEAVRYTDVSYIRTPTGMKKRRQKRGRAGGKPFRMAWANLGRNKTKTALVVISMALAVILFHSTYSIARGFDMEKYLRPKIVSDFILGEASYFQVNKNWGEPILPSVPEEDISKIQKGGQITESGRIYGHRFNISVYTPKEDYRNQRRHMFYATEDDIKEYMQYAAKDGKGNYAADANIYGMEDYPLSRLQALDGDLEDLYDPGQRTVAAVYLVDDYNSPIEYSQWAKVGDTIIIHYVYEWEYFDDETGQQISKEEALRKKRPVRAEEKESADMEYRVAACVAVKNAMSYRGYSGFEYVMNAQVFSNDSHTSDIMTYLFNTTEESNASMQAYLEDYTNNVNQNLDFESKQKYVQAFERYRGMFLLMGGALSFVVGMVGILNFFNAVLTSICTRRREFAVLQSIGMTNRQLKKMLMSEGLLYAAAAVVVSVMCTLLMSPIMDRVVSGIFWFVTYRYTMAPILILVPIFMAFGMVLPLFSYRKALRRSVAERLKESELS